MTSNEGELGAGIQRLFRKWVTGFADVIREAGVPSDVADLRAEDAVLRIQGALILANAINDPSPFQRVMLMLSDSLLATDGSESDAPRRRAAPAAARRATRGMT